ncbi:MAG TPA: class I SAM-dependent methyltransferase, partial [Streptosporangiaceae bacterium]|nr:class I SAM-dependent methyltransferase [Streptosporangiaceae bacterium]
MIWTTSADQPCPAAADLLWPTLERLFHGSLPVRLRAWDGSEIGPPDRPAVIVHDRRTARRLLRQPHELGLARAYIAGELDVDGDLTDCLRLVWQAAREHGLTDGRRPPGRWVSAAGAAARLGVVRLPPRPPASEARTSGQAHAGRQDPVPMTRLDDLRPEFCQLILGPQLACSPALWAPRSRDLAGAQLAALDVLCARLRLRPGTRLLDVGCGWGALAIHAARDFGALVTAVTRSASQAAFVERRAAELGLRSHLTVRLLDWTEISEPPQDAVAIEFGEQIGDPDFATCCDQLGGQLAPGGRLVMRQMSRGAPELGRSAFIDRYIAPDLHMRPVGETISRLERSGLEISDFTAMRQDFTRTVRAWSRNLERRWDEAVTLAGAESARTWQLCLAGLALAFEEGRLGIYQVVAAAHTARPARGGPAGSRPAGAHAAAARSA